MTFTYLKPLKAINYSYLTRSNFANPFKHFLPFSPLPQSLNNSDISECSHFRVLVTRLFSGYYIITMAPLHSVTSKMFLLNTTYYLFIDCSSQLEYKLHERNDFVFLPLFPWHQEHRGTAERTFSKQTEIEEASSFHPHPLSILFS